MQIRDAGHGLMYQYPQLFDKAVTMFLNSNNLKRSIDGGIISSNKITR